MKRQARDYKILIKYVSNNGLIFSLCKEPENLKRGKKNLLMGMQPLSIVVKKHYTAYSISLLIKK